MAQRPKQITIGSQKWKILWVDAIVHDGQELLGLACGSQLELRVVKDRPTSALRETLLHEILHAICFVFGITMPTEGGAHEREEQVVAQLTEPLLLVLRQNPKLADWLAG